MYSDSPPDEITLEDGNTEHEETPIHDNSQ
jgi:hypothetical protein